LSHGAFGKTLGGTIPNAAKTLNVPFTNSTVTVGDIPRGEMSARIKMQSKRYKTHLSQGHAQTMSTINGGGSIVPGSVRIVKNRNSHQNNSFAIPTSINKNNSIEKE
jgi:hypothetical protein